ncbi:MAG: hypothetical protein Kow00128_02930 [Deltaproteobacteria bacterium]
MKGRPSFRACWFLALLSLLGLFPGKSHGRTAWTEILIHFENGSGHDPPAELTLTDPSGRRGIVHPTAGERRNEIPNWKYSREIRYDTWTGKQARDIIEVVVTDPIEGSYELLLSGIRNEAFLLGIVTQMSEQSPDLEEALEGWISAGEVFRYKLMNADEMEKGSSERHKRLLFMTYRFDGFLDPFEPEDPKVFRIGETISVRFHLKDAAGKKVSKAKAWLSITPSHGVLRGKSLGTLPHGGQFACDSATGLYSYDLRTDSLWAGRWQIKVRLGDGSHYHATFELREREGP